MREAARVREAGGVTGAGARAHLGRVLHGVARRARRGDRAAGDPPVSIGGAIGTLEWAVNAYALTFAAGIITAAALGERLGRRRVYVTGLAVFTLASAACAVAPEREPADRSARGAGSRGRRGDAAGPDDSRRGVPGGAARGRRRDLRRDQRARGGRRAAGRRRRHAGARLALDLLDQRAVRSVRRRSVRCCSCRLGGGKLGSAQARLDVPGAVLVSWRRGAARLGARPGRRVRLERPAGARGPARRRSRCSPGS